MTKSEGISKVFFTLRNGSNIGVVNVMLRKPILNADF